MKSIEVEIRAEIPNAQISEIKTKLKSLGFRFIQSKRRTSLMAYGQVHAKGSGWNLKRYEDVDLRARVTNGSAEVVAKIGQTSTHNRAEFSSDVSMEQFYEFACMIGHMGFFAKVGSKRHDDFRKGKIDVSIVQSPSGIAYIELEIMADRKGEAMAHARLKELAAKLHLKTLTHNAFLELCERLTKHDDWEFDGSIADLSRLKKEIQKTGSSRGIS